jgi:DNA-binding transcriptional MerR regulator
MFRLGVRCLFTELSRRRLLRCFSALTLHGGGGITLAVKMERMDPKLLKIGELARLTGLPVKRIHYYERRGLLDPASRSEAGYRLYGREEAARLEFIKRAKLLGLTLEEIRELVKLAARCNEGQILPRLEDVLDAKLRETERRIEELCAFRENLLYYRQRTEDLKDCLPADRYCEDVSFCGCLEAVTEGGEKRGEG